MSETLGELIRRRKGRRTYRDLSEQSDWSPGFTRWQQYAANDLKTSPGAENIRKIAAVLGVSEQEVWMAVGRSLGLDLEAEAEPASVELAMAQLQEAIVRSRAEVVVSN